MCRYDARNELKSKVNRASEDAARSCVKCRKLITNQLLYP
jgi:hypothetical protein